MIGGDPRVDSKIDERLHIEKETDAGCRYLGALNYRFLDWELAITGYDDGYLARFMAALLILNHPTLVD